MHFCRELNEAEFVPRRNIIETAHIFWVVPWSEYRWDLAPTFSRLIKERKTENKKENKREKQRNFKPFFFFFSFVFMSDCDWKESGDKFIKRKNPQVKGVSRQENNKNAKLSYAELVRRPSNYSLARNPTVWAMYSCFFLFPLLFVIFLDFCFFVFSLWWKEENRVDVQPLF